MLDNNRCWREWANRYFSYVTCYCCECKMLELLWRKIWQFPQMPYDPPTPFIVIYTRELKTYVYPSTCTWLFIAALVIRTKKRKQSRYLSADEFIYKMYIHTMEYSLAIKRNGVLLHAVAQMNLEASYWARAKGGRLKRLHFIWFIIWNVQNMQIHGDRKLSSGFRELEGGQIFRIVGAETVCGREGKENGGCEMRVRDYAGEVSRERNHSNVESVRSLILSWK